MAKFLVTATVTHQIEVEAEDEREARAQAKKELDDGVDYELVDVEELGQ